MINCNAAIMLPSSLRTGVTNDTEGVRKPFGVPTTFAPALKVGMKIVSPRKQREL